MHLYVRIHAFRLWIHRVSQAKSRRSARQKSQ